MGNGVSSWQGRVNGDETARGKAYPRVVGVGGSWYRQLRNA